MAICEDCDVVVALKVEERRKRDADAIVATQLTASNLPAVYRDGRRTLANLPADAIAEASALADHLGTDRVRGLMLTGKAGTWKTSFACVVLAREILAGGTGRYVFVPNLFSDIHASYGGFGVTRNDIVAPLISTPRLVLDDLGKEKPSEHAASVLFEILDGRYRSGRGWMIVTSNLGITALAERFAHLGEEVSGPILRRLSEMTVTVPMGRGAA